MRGELKELRAALETADELRTELDASRRAIDSARADAIELRAALDAARGDAKELRLELVRARAEAAERRDALSSSPTPASSAVARSWPSSRRATRSDHLRRRRPCMPPSTASTVPVVEAAAGEAR